MNISIKTPIFSYMEAIITQFELLIATVKNNLGYDFDSSRFCFIRPASDSPKISDADAAAAHIETLWLRASAIDDIVFQFEPEQADDRVLRCIELLKAEFAEIRAAARQIGDRWGIAVPERFGVCFGHLFQASAEKKGGFRDENGVIHRS